MVSFLGQMKPGPSIGEYLIQRLYAHGVRHVFGIPGDYVLGFYDQLFKSKLRIINTCDEQGAGNQRAREESAAASQSARVRHPKESIRTIDRRFDGVKRAANCLSGN